MRRRLTLTTVAAAAIAVIVLGVPLGAAAYYLLTNEARSDLGNRAILAAANLNTLRAGEALPLALESVGDDAGAEIAVVSPGGRLIDHTDGFPVSSLELAADGLEYAGGQLHAVVSTTILGNRVIVHVVEDAGPTQRLVRQAWLLIAVVAATALLVAASAGSRQAREVARPLEDLALTARRLGEGDFSARAARSGLPEADMVADALDSTAERLGVLVERASSFSADASHQLRTPLTALRLNLETLQLTAQDPQLTADALAELDRLDATITELLTLTSPDVSGSTFPPHQLVHDRLDAWQTLAAAEGRRVVTDLQEAPPVHARPAAVGQALQVLLDNAIVHGEGTITVSVNQAGEDARWVRLCVADEGPGFDERRLPPPRPVDRGSSGRGLRLARSLVAAEGGSLRVERTPKGARVCLLLPAGASG